MAKGRPIRHDADIDNDFQPAPRRPSQNSENVPTGPPERGHVKTLNKDRGFGFIKAASGQEYFFHRSETAGAFDTLQEKDAVEFIPMASPKGPRAGTVVLI